MPIHGIHGYTPRPVLPGSGQTPSTPGPDAGATRGPTPARGAPARPAEAAGRAHDAVPAEAPTGTDPMLWSVLTAEERTFFARAKALGQITYAPGAARSAGLPRGGRIDVRV